MTLARRKTLSLVLLTLLCSCGGGESFDRNAMLVSLGNAVFVPSYAKLAEDATQLATATTSLCAAPTSTSLDAAQLAWTNARASLVRTEAFSFGPYMAVPDPAEPALNFWPARTDLAGNVLAGTDPITAPTLANAQKGFPIAEWLLFDPEGGDTAVLARFTDVDTGPRRCAYLMVLATDIVSRTAKLASDWSSPDGYAHELATAGDTSTVYPLTRLALADVLERVVFVLEDMRDMKLGAPLGLLSDSLPHANLVESPFAQRSIAALLDDLTSLEAVYTGDYGDVTGIGLADWLITRNPGLDVTVRAQIDAARTAILAIEGPLDVAVVSHRDQVIAAHDAIRELHRTIGVDVAGALAVTISFNDTDGD